MDEASIDLLLSKLDSKLDEKLHNQTLLITKTVTQNVMEALDEKVKLITEENKDLKNKVTELQQKLCNIDKEKRKNNLIFFGISELGKSEPELVDYIKETIIEMEIYIESHEINNIYRIGKWTGTNNRPVVVSFSTVWKKHLILKNKSKLPEGVYIKEDYSKEVLEKRKQLQPQVEEEKKKGNIAFLVQDKLVVKKPKETTREKRKREESKSPNSSAQKKITTPNNEPIEEPLKPQTTEKATLKPSILNFVEKRNKPPLPALESSKN